MSWIFLKGSFKIMNVIYLIHIRLFALSVSWGSFGHLCLSKNLLISFRFLYLALKIFIIFPYIFYRCMIYSDVPLFISDTDKLGPLLLFFSPPFISIAKGLAILLVFDWFLFFISFLFILGFICYSFSCVLRWKSRLLSLYFFFLIVIQSY